MGEAILMESCGYSPEVKTVNTTRSICFVVRKALWYVGQSRSKDARQVPSRTVLRFFIWCLLGLAQRFSIIRQSLRWRGQGAQLSITYRKSQWVLQFLLQTSGCCFCRGSPCLSPFSSRLLCVATQAQPCCLPPTLPLGNTPEQQKAEDKMIYESLQSTDSWRNPHSLFLRRQLQQRQNRPNTCRLRKTAWSHFRSL